MPADIAIALESPRQPQVIALIETLDAFNAALYPPEANHHLDIEALCAPDIRFLVARRGDDVIGIGALWLQPERGFGEVKRMYVSAAARGTGLGPALLGEIETMARAAGLPALMLETGTQNFGALKLYERAGFTTRGPFGDYPDHQLSVFMEKRL